MTERRIIALSRAIGAGGEEIGRAVATQLGLRYADEEIIVAAAEAAGVDAARVAEAETTPALITRILEALGRSPIVGEGYVAPVLEEAPSAYEALIERVVKETAQQGDVVIVGHAASIPLAGMPGLLRVLVTAPAEVRAGRLAQAEGMDEGKAKRVVKDSDNQRRQYLKRFYGVEEEQPSHYDLVVSTETLSAGEAAGIVVAAAS
jgi:cytidylate kinase